MNAFTRRSKRQGIWYSHFLSGRQRIQQCSHAEHSSPIGDMIPSCIVAVLLNSISVRARRLLEQPGSGRIIPGGIEGKAHVGRSAMIKEITELIGN